MNTTFVVDSTDAGQRLDKFLVQRFPERSRTRIQKWITNGLVTVNEKEVSKHHFLDHQDVVAVNIQEEPEKRDDSMKQDIPVLHEDEEIIVLNKPIGILVHPAQKHNEWTLVDFLKEHCPSIQEVGEDPQRPGIVHRLDRNVSGVMVVAKTQQAFEHLKKQFADRTVKKEYRAIVFGIPSEEAGVIKFTIARSKTKQGKMAARPEHEEGKDAWTEYEVLRTFRERYSSLAVSIKTGRTHQIRAHLAAIDHPVVGDALYYSNHYKSKKEFPRLLLHAYKLELEQPVSGERIGFEATIPEDIATFQ